SIVTPQLTLNCPDCAGTIANSSGNVQISGNLTFNGQHFALLASGDIENLGAVTIDLSNSSSLVNQGNGGNFVAIAGFDFTPTTPGQIGPVQTGFTIGSPSASGGSILLGSTTINTSTTVAGANGGSV